MCAVLILGVAVAGMTHGIAAALRASQEAEHLTKAAELAASRVELLRAEGFLMEDEDEGEGAKGLGDYHWRQKVTETDLEGLFEVVVTVWQGKSESSVYELRTLLFDPPAGDLSEDGRRSGDREGKGRRSRARP